MCFVFRGLYSLSPLWLYSVGGEGRFAPHFPGAFPNEYMPQRFRCTWGFAPFGDRRGAIHAGIDTFVLLFLERLGARQLEIFFATLVATMTVAMGWMYAHAECPTVEVIKGSLIPTLRLASSLQQQHPLLVSTGISCRCSHDQR